MTESGLTRYELELMDVLWGIREGTVQDVCSRMDRDLAYTTVMTTLNLLVTKKGVLERQKQGRAFLYRPLVSREAISRSVFAELRDLLFGNRFPSLVLKRPKSASEARNESADQRTILLATASTGDCIAGSRHRFCER